MDLKKKLYKYLFIENHRNKLFWILFAIGLLICSFKLSNITYQSVQTEESINIIAFRMTRNHGIPMFPSRNLYYQSFFSSIIYSIVSLIFGDHIIVYRLFSLALHFLVPLIAFLLARGFLKSEILFVSGIIYYLHPWGTEYSRVATHHIFLQLMMTVSIMVFIGRVFFEYKKKYDLFYFLTGIIHKTGAGLILSFFSLFFISPSSFIKKHNVLKMIFWTFFFGIIYFQRIILENFGLIYLDNNLFQNIDIKDDYFRLLFDSHPIAIIALLSGLILFILKIIYLKQEKKKLEANDNILFFLIIFLLLFMVLHGICKECNDYNDLLSIHYIFLVTVVGIVFKFGMFPLRYIERIWNIPKEKALKILLLLTLSLLIIDNTSIYRNIQITQRDYNEMQENNFSSLFPCNYLIDHKSIGGFISENRKETDIIISKNHINLFVYTGHVDYWLFPKFGDTEKFTQTAGNSKNDIFLGIPIIANTEILDGIIRTAVSRNNRIWLAYSGLFCESHREINDYLLDYKENIMWMGRDGKSRVYLFDGNEIENNGFKYKASWGIYTRSRINIYDIDDIKISRRKTYKTANIFYGDINIRLYFRERNPMTKLQIIFKSNEIEYEPIYSYLDKNYIDLKLNLPKDSRSNIILRVQEGPPVFLEYIKMY